MAAMEASLLSKSTSLYLYMESVVFGSHLTRPNSPLGPERLQSPWHPEEKHLETSFIGFAVGF